MGEIKGFTQGSRIGISATKEGFDWRVVAHELKYSFAALDWNYRIHKFETNSFKRIISSINDAMPWNKNWVELSECEVELLNKSRFFNPNQPFFDNPPEITMKVSPMDKSNTQRYQFAVTDEDGIHQVKLYSPLNPKYNTFRDMFHGCQTLNGKKVATVDFELSNLEIKNVELRMIDMLGNIASREFRIKEKTSETSQEE